MPPPVLPDPGPNVTYHPLSEGGSGEGRGLSCEVRATRSDDLAASVDELLRALAAHAALIGAVFEARAVRLSEPLVPGVLLVGEMARHLSSSGLAVCFGPSSSPAPDGAEICIGASGREREIERFLLEHPAWHPVSL